MVVVGNGGYTYIYIYLNHFNPVFFLYCNEVLKLKTSLHHNSLEVFCAIVRVVNSSKVSVLHTESSSALTWCNKSKTQLDFPLVTFH